MDPDLLLIGVEDTDTEDSDIGTGKMTRMLGPKLPAGAVMVGVVRHQLLLHPLIPYTSWNSPACAIVKMADPAQISEIADMTRQHVKSLAAEGSNPGICLATVGEIGPEIIAFGIDCCRRVLTQQDAREAGKDVILEGLAGNKGGIIGALGSVGLTAHGWCGRFIEVTALNTRPLRNTVAELEECGVRLVVMERDAPPPLGEDIVTVPDQFRPKLIAGAPALLIYASGAGQWECEAWPKRKG